MSIDYMKTNCTAFFNLPFISCKINCLTQTNFCPLPFNFFDLQLNINFCSAYNTDPGELDGVRQLRVREDGRLRGDEADGQDVSKIDREMHFPLNSREGTKREDDGKGDWLLYFYFFKNQ